MHNNTNITKQFNIMLSVSKKIDSNIKIIVKYNCSYEMLLLII